MVKIKIRMLEKMLEKSRNYFKKNPRIKKISKLFSFYYGFIGIIGTISILIIIIQGEIHNISDKLFFKKLYSD